MPSVQTECITWVQCPWTQAAAMSMLSSDQLKSASGPSGHECAGACSWLMMGLLPHPNSSQNGDEGPDTALGSSHAISLAFLPCKESHSMHPQNQSVYWF